MPVIDAPMYSCALAMKQKHAPCSKADGYAFVTSGEGMPVINSPVYGGAFAMQQQKQQHQTQSKKHVWPYYRMQSDMFV